MPKARDVSNKAVKLAEKGRYDEALVLVNKAIKLDGDNADVWYNSGTILFKMCRYRDALNSFAQVTDIDPGFTEAWYNKGMALVSLGKHLEAIHAFDKVLKIDPRDRRAREQLNRAQKNVMSSSSFSPRFKEGQTKLSK
jgi:tetratricopeptide (TPR) repeat protein